MDISVVHFWINPPHRNEEGLVACIKHYHWNGNALPSAVTCLKCKETQAYKEILYEIEIGYDGNEDVWWELFSKKIGLVI